jgi:PTH1 family peptidyl-tRNA hydrolase
MKIIAGLGNPGPKYLMTRHNAGFLVVDALIQTNKCSQITQEHKSQVCKFKIQGEDVIVVKPQTFMNLSGQAIAPLMNYYKLSLSDLLVVHDEVDLPFGTIKFQTHRGHGGHNGVRNIHELLGTKDYARLRIGINRPPHQDMSVADYALQNFNKSEQSQLNEIISRSASGIECFILEGLNIAATRYNEGKTV